MTASRTGPGSFQCSRAGPSHKPSATLAAAIWKGSENAENAFKEVFTMGTPDIATVAAIRTLDDFSFTLIPLAHWTLPPLRRVRFRAPSPGHRCV